MIAALLALILVGAQPQTSGSGERIAEITVHGNVVTPDDEIRRVAELEVGMAVGPATIEEAAERLRRSGRFRSVDVRKRFASIEDPTQIAVVIVVDEGDVHVERGREGQPAHVVKNRRPRVMFLPILNAEDGYGLTYGARFAVPGKLGPDSRISFPLSWGGERQAAVELDKQLDAIRLTRFTGGAGISRRVNPHYDEGDTRFRVWGRGERELAKSLRVGIQLAWQHVQFGGSDDLFLRGGVDATLDTRIDPVLARNAVYVHAGVERIAFASRSGATTTTIDARGYLGMIGQTVLVGRFFYQGASTPLPPYLKLPFGGIGTVRGFRVGETVGDQAMAGTGELLVPLTSPLHLARLGVSGFFDVGAAYDAGQQIADRPLQRGVGGSVWMTATFIRVSVAVAHGIGASTRVHVGGTVTF